MREIQVYKLHTDAVIPTRAYSTDAGLDLYSLKNVFIPLNQTIVISTGLALRVPEGFVGKIEDRSSMSVKGLRTGGGVIDHGYTGQIEVVMHNLSNMTSLHGYENGYWILQGDKIAQILFYKVEVPEVREVNFLWDSTRENNGFGSSGSNYGNN